MVVKGTIMTTFERIQKLVKKNNGYITGKEVAEDNIPSIYLSRYVKKYGLKQIARGFYALEDWMVDPYLVFQYTYPKFIYSYDSAIYLNGLGDALPNYFEVTGPFNYRPMSKVQEGVITHTDTVDETYNLGVIKVKNSFGNEINIYDKEKTICDLIKHKDRIDFEVYAKALNQYAKAKDKNINKLMEYAHVMKIENKVRSQMEVILNAN